MARYTRVKRAVCLVAIALAACQSQSSGHAPSPSPANGKYVDRIYVQNSSTNRVLELDWSGKIIGAVPTPGFGNPSADGSRFVRGGDQSSIEDWRGQRIAAFDAGLSAYGPPSWADDNTQLCGVQYPANGDPTKASVWILTPGKSPRIVATVDTPGGAPAVEACSVANNGIVVAAGAEPHWPPGAERYLITTEVTALNLSTGAIEYHHVYPQGNMGSQADMRPRGDWVLVTPSPDGRYLAEYGIFSRTTAIRDITADRVVATVSGRVAGFSSDGSRVAVVVTSGAASEVRVETWADQQVIWRTPGTSVAVLPRAKSSDLLLAVPNAAGSQDIYVLTGNKAITIAANVFMQWMCPCYPGA